MKRNIIATAVFIFGALLFIAAYPTEKALPPSSAFIIKRIQERVIEKTKQSSEEKYAYAVELLNKRLYEIDLLVQNEQYDQLISASSKHSVQAYEIITIVENNTMTGKQEEVHELFDTHREKLRTVMPHIIIFEPSYNSLLQAADTLDIYESELTG